MARAELIVLGVGNTLLGDEGFGVYVVRELERQDLPCGVKVIEGGVGGFALLDIIQEAPKAIIVDAADMGMEPGSLKRFTPGEVVSVRDEGGFSLHPVGLLEVLELAQTLGHDLEVVIIGVQPETLGPMDGLSPTLQSKVPEAVKLVQVEIEEYLADKSAHMKGA
jgi:hydrogenase maturation protease